MQRSAPFDGGKGGVPFPRHGGEVAFPLPVTVDLVFHQKVHGSGSLFQIVQFRPVREAGALLGFQIVLQVNEQADPSVALFWLPGGCRRRWRPPYSPCPGFSDG